MLCVLGGQQCVVCLCLGGEVGQLVIKALQPVIALDDVRLHVMLWYMDFWDTCDELVHVVMCNR